MCMYSIFTTLKRYLLIYYLILYIRRKKGTEKLNNLNARNQAQNSCPSHTQPDSIKFWQAAASHEEEMPIWCSRAMRWEWAWHLQETERSAPPENREGEVYSMKNWMPLGGFKQRSDMIWHIFLKDHFGSCRGTCSLWSSAWLWVWYHLPLCLAP